MMDRISTHSRQLFAEIIASEENVGKFATMIELPAFGGGGRWKVVNVCSWRIVWSSSYRGVVVPTFIVLPPSFSSPLLSHPLAYSSLATLNRSLLLHLCNCACSVTGEIVVADIFTMPLPSFRLRTATHVRAFISLEETRTTKLEDGRFVGKGIGS